MSTRTTVTVLDSRLTELAETVALLITRIAVLEALPLPTPQTTSKGDDPASDRQLGLLIRLGEFPDFATAKAAGHTKATASARLQEFKALHAGTPAPAKRVKCVHCTKGSHKTAAKVRACWESANAKAA